EAAKAALLGEKTGDPIIYEEIYYNHCIKHLAERSTAVSRFNKYLAVPKRLMSSMRAKLRATNRKTHTSQPPNTT
ncbi:MAG: hypothetical protein ACYC05_15515, partial [Sulfuricella sp.]